MRCDVTRRRPRGVRSATEARLLSAFRCIQSIPLTIGPDKVASFRHLVKFEVDVRRHDVPSVFFVLRVVGDVRCRVALGTITRASSTWKPPKNTRHLPSQIHARTSILYLTTLAGIRIVQIFAMLWRVHTCSVD